MTIVGSGGLSAVQLTSGANAITASGGDGGLPYLKHVGCMDRHLPRRIVRTGNSLGDGRFVIPHIG